MTKPGVARKRLALNLWENMDKWKEGSVNDCLEIIDFVLDNIKETPSAEKEKAVEDFVKWCNDQQLVEHGTFKGITPQIPYEIYSAYLDTITNQN